MSELKESKPESVFFPVTDPARKLALLKKAAIKRAHCDIWTDRNELTTQVQVNRYEEKSNLLIASFENDTAGALFHRKVEVGKFSTFYLRIHFPTSLLFARSQKLRWTGKVLEIDLSSTIQLVQRRRFPRIPLPPIYPTEASFCHENDPITLLRAPIHDLSASGLSLVNPTHPLNLEFKKGTELINLTFSIYGEKIAGSGQIRERFKHPSKGPCVGVELKGLAPKQIRILQLFVEQEGLKFCSDLLREQTNGI